MRKIFILMFACLLNFFPAYSSADVFINNLPKEIPASDLKRTDGAHPEYMKQFAEWTYRFFGREPQMREVIKKMMQEQKDNKDQTQEMYQEMYRTVELYKIGGVEIKKQDDLDIDKIKEKLNDDERKAVDSSFKYIAFYLLFLPAEEEIKTGAIPRHNSSESLDFIYSPDGLKKLVLGILAPYKSGKFKTKGEIRKEQEKNILNSFPNIRQEELGKIDFSH